MVKCSIELALTALTVVPTGWIACIAWLAAAHGSAVGRTVVVPTVGIPTAILVAGVGSPLTDAVATPPHVATV